VLFEDVNVMPLLGAAAAEAATKVVIAVRAAAFVADAPIGTVHTLLTTEPTPPL